MNCFTGIAPAALYTPESALEFFPRITGLIDFYDFLIYTYLKDTAVSTHATIL